MTNAKAELLELVEEVGTIKCAEIGKHERNKSLLRVGHSADDLNLFLNSIDFNYDSGFGGQELYGIIWFDDGTWATRGEYDGSEWWEHHELPAIPDNLA